MKAGAGWLLAAALALNAAASGSPADSGALPAYRPVREVSGTIRSWGHGFLRPTMKRWEAGFRKYQPNVRFEDRLATSAAAMAGLYSRQTDLGVLAREITPPEIAAYEKMTGQKVFPVVVMAGSLGDQDRIMALGIFVNRANPISRLSFGQLESIWGSEARRGGQGLIRSWDQLGLQGDWQRRPIDPYSGPAAEAPAFFFSQTAMHGSVLWNCALRQYGNVEQEIPSTGTEATAPFIRREVDAYQEVVNAVARDRYGIGISGAGYANPNAKLVAVAAADGGPYIVPSRGTVADFTYPLARPVTFYINDGPAIAPTSAVVEFLRYILSREGQEAVRREGKFLPLTAATVSRQRSRLPW